MPETGQGGGGGGGAVQRSTVITVQDMAGICRLHLPPSSGLQTKCRRPTTKKMATSSTLSDSTRQEQSGLLSAWLGVPYPRMRWQTGRHLESLPAYYSTVRACLPELICLTDVSMCRWVDGPMGS